jgi:hypothetical protein
MRVSPRNITGLVDALVTGGFVTRRIVGVLHRLIAAEAAQ